VPNPGATAAGVGEEVYTSVKEWVQAMDVDDDARTIGRRLRQIRQSRRKSLRVIAGLAGISASHLSRIENGQRALDSRSLTVALANALQIAPSELTRLPVPAPANGHSDAAIDAVRRALIAISRHRPGGRVVSLEELRARARAMKASITSSAVSTCRI
jgi:transcriptional regulator with XRE-family HTH domain